ncbi:MAG: hypothetical protein ACK5M7_21355 [Draconibacterium sp.]
MNIDLLFHRRGLLMIVILCFTWVTTNAQDTEKTNSQFKRDSVDFASRLAERAEKLKTKNTEKASPNNEKEASVDDPMLPDSPNAFLADSLTNKKYQAALQEYYNYHVSGLKHRMKVFSWQLFSSKLIFVVVLILVFAGIYFAAVQFHVGIKQAKEKSEEFNDRTEISASMEGIKVSSPVLGVIILVISLAFFYFYLVYVFPIEDIF